MSIWLSISEIVTSRCSLVYCSQGCTSVHRQQVVLQTMPPYTNDPAMPAFLTTPENWLPTIGDGTKNYCKLLTRSVVLTGTQPSNFLACTHIHGAITLWTCIPACELKGDSFDADFCPSAKLKYVYSSVSLSHSYYKYLCKPICVLK